MGDPRVALITGGSKGIGFGIAQQLARRNIENLVLVARKEADLKLAQQTLQTHYPGTSVEIFPADLTDPVVYDNLYKYMEQNYGKIDILVNNAGEFFQLDMLPDGTPVTKEGRRLDPSEVARIIQQSYLLNAAAPASFAVGFRKLLINAPQPKVLDVLSSAAAVVYKDNIPYRQSKLAHEDTSLCLESYTNTAVRTYRIYPSNTDTAMVAHFDGPKLTPEIVGKAGVDMMLDDTATDLAIKMKPDGHMSIAKFRERQNEKAQPYEHAERKSRILVPVFD